MKIFLSGLLSAMFLQAAAVAQDMALANQKLFEKLATQSIGQVALELQKSPPPASAQELLESFNVFARAGYYKELEKLLPLIQQYNCGADAFDGILINRKQWRLLRLLYEQKLTPAFPPSASLLNDHWEEMESPQSAWDWLRERARYAESQKVKNGALGRNNLGEAWMVLLFDFARKRNQMSELIDQYHRRLEKNPQDVKTAMELARGYLTNDRGVKIDWLATTMKLDTALDNYQFGREFRSNEPELAIIFLTKALKLPFTEAEKKFMKEMEAQDNSLRMSPADYQSDFQRMIHYALLEAYRKSNQGTEARQILELLTKDGGRPVSAYNAGVIQGLGVGAEEAKHQIPPDVPKTENEKPRDYWYWKEQGEYYCGKRDFDAATEAFEKALSLAPVPEPDAKDSSNENAGQARFWVFSSYAYMLNQAGKKSEARQLILTDVKKWPVNLRLTALLLDYAGYCPKFDDDFFWQFLAERIEWDYMGVKGAFIGMAKNATPEQREQIWSRAEKLIAKRNYAWGNMWVLRYAMRECEEYDREFALIKKLLNRPVANQDKQSLYFDYFSACLKLHRWQEAEQILQTKVFPVDDNYLRMLSRVGEEAVQQGDKQNALCVMKKILAYDRKADSVYLPNTLIKTGMKNELAALFQNIITAEPDCVEARNMLVFIEKQPDVKIETDAASH